MNVFKNGKLVTVTYNGKKQVITGKKPTTPILVTSISITNKITSLMQGNTYQLQVSILPSNATDKTLTYSSSNSSIATVNSSGVIAGVASGTVTITVKSTNNITDTMMLTIQSATIPVTSVTLNKTSSTLVEGGTETLTATVLPSNATNSSVTWSSSDITKATVSNGLVTAIKAGSVTITVTTNDGSKNATCTYTINSATVSVTGVTVSPISGTLYTGQTTKLTATITPSNATNQAVSWSSSNTTVATVDSNGNVTAVAIGGAVIKCATLDGGFIANYNLSVIEQASNEDINKYIYPNDLGTYITCDGRLVTDETLFDEGSKFYSTSTIDTITYNSTEQRYYLNKKVHSGIIRDWNSSVRQPIYIVGNYYAIGNASIGDLLCKQSSSSASTPSSLVINIQNTVPISHNSSTDYSNTSTEYPLGISTYGSFTGMVTTYANPYSMTTTDIVNFMNGKEIRWISATTLSIPLLKEGETIAVTGLNYNKAIMGLETNSSKTLIAETIPSLATNNTVLWSSSDESIATVDDNGKVTAVSEGKAVITATTQEGGFSSSTSVIISEPYTEEHLFNGAYVQMYYYEPKIDLGTNLVIPFYISDEEQTEFYTDDYSKRFTLIVTIDDVERRFTGLQAGDQEVNLGKLTEGEHSIVFQGIDESTGAKGMAIYKEVWVVNPATYSITEAQTYTMTSSDLTTFSINNQNNDDLTICTATKDGLNNLWNWCVSQGYRKIIMLPGTYRVECSEDAGRAVCLKIPSGFTIDGVDANLVKFKRKPLLADSINKKTTFRWDDPIDSHLINCTIEDDNQERIDNGNDSYTYDVPNGESFNTFWLVGGRYSSIENCIITNSVGHGVVNSGGIAKGFALPKYTFDSTKPTIVDSTNNTVEKCFILNGQKISSDKYVTTAMTDLKTWTSQFIIFGNNSGYSWFRGISQYVYYHFYNEDGDFVVTIPSMQYRPVMIPVGCRFVRASILSYATSTEGGAFYYKEQGTHLSLSDNYFENCRTTCYAPTCSRGLLMDSNTYINCGRRITPSAVDFEDGWQQSIDVFYRNNSSTPHANSTADVITVCGVNHVYENNDDRIFGKHYMAGCVYRNNNSGKFLKIGLSYDQYSRYNRVYNNENSNLLISQWIGEFTQAEIDLKEKHAYTGVNGGSIVSSPTGYRLYGTELDYPHSKVRNAKVRTGAADGWFVKCDIYPQPYLGSNLFFEQCNFYNFDDINTSITTSFNAADARREFTGCTFKSPASLRAHNTFNTGYFKDCTFEQTATVTTNNTNKLGDVQFDNCIFKQKVTITATATSYIQFNNCTFENGYTLSGAYGANVQFNTTIPSKAVSAFRITSASYSVKVAGTVQTNSWVTPANATNKSITWTSSNTAVATVNSIGLITGVAAGVATITGTTVDGSYSASCTITVS